MNPIDANSSKNGRQLNVLQDVEVLGLVVSDSAQGCAYVTTRRSSGSTDRSWIYNEDAFPAQLACLAARLVKGNSLMLGVSIETSTDSLEQVILETRYPSGDSDLISKIAVPSLVDGYYSQIFTTDSQNDYCISHLKDYGNVGLTYAAIVGCIENLRVQNELDDPVRELNFKKVGSYDSDPDDLTRTPATALRIPSAPPPRDNAVLATGAGDGRAVPSTLQIPNFDSGRSAKVTFDNTEFSLSSAPIANIGMIILLQFALVYDFSVYFESSGSTITKVEMYTSND